MLGCWHETAGSSATLDHIEEREGRRDERSETENNGNYATSALQLDCIKNNVRHVIDHNGLQKIFDLMRSCCQRAWLVLLSTLPNFIIPG